MDVSNSVLITPIAPDSLSRNDQNRVNSDSRSARQDSPTSPSKALASPADLERRSNEIQFNKVQRVESLDAAPLRNQQAVNTYQQTEDAGRAFTEGELVGVDLFV